MLLKNLATSLLLLPQSQRPSVQRVKDMKYLNLPVKFPRKSTTRITGAGDGDENNFFLAKIVIAGLQKNRMGKNTFYFAEKLTGKISDYYIYAHRGRYNGRFWRVGMCELLFDHQLRANEIGNQLARGLEWASKTIFRSEDPKVLQNIRADLDNGEWLSLKI